MRAHHPPLPSTPPPSPMEPTPLPGETLRHPLCKRVPSVPSWHPVPRFPSPTPPRVQGKRGWLGRGCVAPFPPTPPPPPPGCCRLLSTSPEGAANRSAGLRFWSRLPPPAGVAELPPGAPTPWVNWVHLEGGPESPTGLRLLGCHPWVTPPDHSPGPQTHPAAPLGGGWGRGGGVGCVASVPTAQGRGPGASPQRHRHRTPAGNGVGGAAVPGGLEKGSCSQGAAGPTSRLGGSWWGSGVRPGCASCGDKGHEGCAAGGGASHRQGRGSVSSSLSQGQRDHPSGAGWGGIVPETPGLSQPAQDTVPRATHARAAPSHRGAVIPPPPRRWHPRPRPLAAGHTSPFPMRQLSFSFIFFPSKKPLLF